MAQALVVTLENGEEYTEISRVDYNNEQYLLLSNSKNPKDTCIRKLKKELGKDYVCRLEEEELKMVLNLFIKQSNINLNSNN